MHGRGVRSTVLALCATAIAGLAITAPAYAGTKQYLANFSPTNVNAGTFSITATITNESEPQTMGAINVLVPAGLTVTGITATSSSNGSWTAATGTCPNLNTNTGSAPCVQLRGASL